MLTGSASSESAAPGLPRTCALPFDSLALGLAPERGVHASAGLAGAAGEASLHICAIAKPHKPDVHCLPCATVVALLA